MNSKIKPTSTNGHINHQSFVLRSDHQRVLWDIQNRKSNYYSMKCNMMVRVLQLNAFSKWMQNTARFWKETLARCNLLQPLHNDSSPGASCESISNLWREQGSGEAVDQVARPHWRMAQRAPPRLSVWFSLLRQPWRDVTDEQAEQHRMKAALQDQPTWFQKSSLVMGKNFS